MAGTSEKGCCPSCGSPYERIVKRTRMKRNELPEDDVRYRPNTYDSEYGDINGKSDAGYTHTETVGWELKCKCGVGGSVPCVVLDPFGGSGTTGIVAYKYGQNSILLELNPEYVEIMKGRFTYFIYLFPNIFIFFLVI